MKIFLIILLLSNVYADKHYCRTSVECQFLGYLFCMKTSIFHIGHCLGCSNNTHCKNLEYCDLNSKRCLSKDIVISSSSINKPMFWMLLLIFVFKNF